MKKLAILFTLSTMLSTNSWGQTEVRLAVHDSYDLPQPVMAAFERANDAKVSIIKMGDGNEMLNRLILTKNGAPLADAVFGLDNNTAAKAYAAGILAQKQPESVATVVPLKYALAVDYGFVTLNYDKKWVAEHRLPLPKTLQDLAKPQYKNLMVTPNPATSTPALAFLLANIAELGEDGAFQWWAAMRQNGVKVTKGWSEAYYTEFSLNGGSRPIMVGYASSPAAEVFYSKGKLRAPNMGNVFLKGGSYLQIEGAAVLNKAKQPELAAKLVQYLQSPAVQQSVTTSMWVYPAAKGTRHHAMITQMSVPRDAKMLPAETVNAKQKTWLARWVRTVLR